MLSAHCATFFYVHVMQFFLLELNSAAECDMVKSS